MQNDFAGQGFFLLESDANSRFQVMHFRVATGHVDALAAPMSAKIEEHDIVAAVIFEGCHRAQGRAGDPVSMADNDGGGGMRLCPELAVQQFSITGMEKKCALEGNGWFRQWFGQFPGKVFAINSRMGSGKFFYKEARQHNQAGGCCDAHDTSACCQAHYPAAFIQFAYCLSMRMNAFCNGLDQFVERKVSFFLDHTIFLHIVYEI